MLEYLSYILFFSVLIAFLIYIYIRVKFGFWAIQPVFHIYDIGYAGTFKIYVFINELNMKKKIRILQT